MTEKVGHEEHPASHPAGAHPAAEEDRVKTWTIVAVGVGALVLFFAASMAAIGAMHRQQREILPQGPAPLPAELGRSKIGLLEQRLFENSNQAESMRATQGRKLETYGWVDAEKGIVRIPIRDAMELVLKGERPQGEPARHTHDGGGAQEQPARPPGPPTPASPGRGPARDGGARR